MKIKIKTILFWSIIYIICEIIYISIITFGIPYLKQVF